MALRQQVVFVLTGVFAAMGAQFRTTNFLVEAPTPQIAQQAGQMAEHYRREKALEWLGREMPPWPEPCPLRLKVTMGGAGGATSFAFDQGRVLGQQMNIEGSLDRLLASVLPHEVTHTVFAHFFRCPVPRWADEGGAVLSEDEIEKNRHDQLVRQILNQGRAIPLRRLFGLRDYPNDVMCLYAEGFSVANYLVAASNRPAFLNFVAHGMQYGWDNAVQTYYHFQSVEELEQAWLSHLRSTRRPTPTLVAQNNQPAPADPGRRTIVRLTAPPAQPLQDSPAPVFRGQMGGPEPEERGQPYRPVSGRPGYLPEYNPTPAPQPAAPPDGWQPVPIQEMNPSPPPVRLGQPQFPPAPPPAPNYPPSASPIGYPR
jgi:hypothetical protein